MFKILKKTLAVCLVGFGLRHITCNITSNDRLAIFNWSGSSSSGFGVASMLRYKQRSACI